MRKGVKQVGYAAAGRVVAGWLSGCLVGWALLGLGLTGHAQELPQSPAARVVVAEVQQSKLDTQQTERKRRATYVIPTEETEQWIGAFNTYMETSRPRYLPCVIPPKQWTDVRGGGYYGHEIDKLPIVRRK